MSSSDEDYCDEAREYYNKVTDAFHGLFDVLNIALNPNSVYLHCGMDNLEALKSNLIDLLLKGYDTFELQDSLRKIEFNKKKSSFSDKTKKKKQEKKQDEEKTT